MQRYCDKCNYFVGDLSLFLKKEDYFKNSFYVKQYGLYELKIFNCETCKEKGVVIVSGKLGGKIYNWRIRDYIMRDPVNEWWAIYLLNIEYLVKNNNKINNELYSRIKGILNNNYLLIRCKENDKYWTFEIFGFNGDNLYIKQMIGIKKE